MEGSALCLVFCSTLAALVSVILVLYSLILRSLHGRVIYGTPLTVRLEKNSSSKAQLWFYLLPPKPFSPGFREPEGHLYFIPPWASAPLSVGPKRVDCRATSGQLEGWFYSRMSHSVCPENEMRATPIGICRHIRAALLVLFYHCRNVL